VTKYVKVLTCERQKCKWMNVFDLVGCESFRDKLFGILTPMLRVSMNVEDVDQNERAWWNFMVF
jgi:hypothetical protein